MTTLKTIAVSSNLFRQLESLAQARGLNVMRLVEPIMSAGIAAAKSGAEIPVDFGKPEGVSSQPSDALAVTKTPDKHVFPFSD